MTPSPPVQIPESLQSSKYTKDFNEALECFKEKRFEDCVKTAKYNLKGPTLPRYHRIKNHILITLASEEDWLVGERHRLRAEEIWREAKSLTKSNQTTELYALEDVRKELDEVESVQREKRAVWEGKNGAMELSEKDFELEPDGDGEERVDPMFEDAEAVREVEERIFGSGMREKE